MQKQLKTVLIKQVNYCHIVSVSTLLVNVLGRLQTLHYTMLEHSLYSIEFPNNTRESIDKSDNIIGPDFLSIFKQKHTYLVFNFFAVKC